HRQKSTVPVSRVGRNPWLGTRESKKKADPFGGPHVVRPAVGAQFTRRVGGMQGARGIRPRATNPLGPAAPGSISPHLGRTRPSPALSAPPVQIPTRAATWSRFARTGDRAGPEPLILPALPPFLCKSKAQRLPAPRAVCGARSRRTRSKAG